MLERGDVFLASALHSDLASRVEPLDLLLEVEDAPQFLLSHAWLAVLAVIQLQPLGAEVEDLELKVGNLNGKLYHVGEEILLPHQQRQAVLEGLLYGLVESLLLHHLITAFDAQLLQRLQGAFQVIAAGVVRLDQLPDVLELGTIRLQL